MNIIDIKTDNNLSNKTPVPSICYDGKHLENIVDAAPIGILTYGYDEKIIVTNQQMAYYLEKNPHEIVGQNIKNILEYLNPEFLILVDAVKNRHSVFEEYYPADIRGEKIYFNVKGVVLPEQGLLLFENVTGIKEYQDSLKALDKSKDEFISIASHDMRTPITAIRGYLQMVLNEEVGKLSTSQMKEYLELARAGIVRLNDLVEDMLSVSRIEQKRLKFDIQEAGIEKLIDGMVKESMPSVAKKGLYIKFEQPEDLPKCQIDPNRFMEVLGNLITNATKFTEKGGITIKAIPREDLVRIDVVDTGMGISVSDQKKIFKKFYQLDSSTSSQNQGTGLGLYISKMITEKMGGRIGVISEQGKGSDFFFTVPIISSPLAKRAKEAIDRENVETSAKKCYINDSKRTKELVKKNIGGNLGKVLIIEDDPLISKMYSEKLSRDGFEVDIAENGQIGIEKLKASAPSLVIADIMMPVLSGVEVIEEMKKDQNLAKIPIIVLSNLTGGPDIEKAKSLGINEYLIKSNLDPSDITNLVKKYI